MGKSTRRAGQNIRELELKRRESAMLSFGAAVLVLILPFGVTKFLIEPLLQLLSNLSSNQPEPTINLPPIVYAVALVIAVLCVSNGMYWWQRADHAAQGAKGEEEVAQEIKALIQEGWQVKYGMRLGNKLGDADIVCRSPQGKVYVIDVKSHRGEVRTDGKVLYRRMGQQDYSFEKNFLTQVKRQAVQVNQQQNYGFVTPIVAFSNAQVAVSNQPIQKVYVVEKAQLVNLLKSLG